MFEGERLVGKLTIDALPYPSLAHTFWVHAVYVHPDARGTGASSRADARGDRGARERKAHAASRFGSMARTRTRAALYERSAFAKPAGFRRYHGRRRAMWTTC